MASLFIIILTANCSALNINEIESNPEGKDSGAEWIELYSDDEINLEGYYLENGDGGIYNLSGIFRGYMIITFPNLWLDNSNETVYLKNSLGIVDSAGPYSDNKKEKTYSLCDGDWIFTESTKNAENSCNEEAPHTPEPREESVEIENQEEVTEIVENKKETRNISFNESIENPINNKMILLNNRQLKDNEEITKTYKTRFAVIYFFMGFCILLVILIALKKL